MFMLILLVFCLVLLVVVSSFGFNSAVICFCMFSYGVLYECIPKTKLKVRYKNRLFKKNVPKDFEMKYTELYNNYVKPLGIIRKKVQKELIMYYIVPLLPFFIFSIIGNSEFIVNLIGKDSKMEFLIPISFVLIMFMEFKNRDLKQKYIQTYKKEIITKFIKLINQKLEYEIDFITFRLREEYILSEFGNKVFNEFKSNDYIKGFINENQYIKMADIFIKGVNIYKNEDFSGIFTCIESKNNIGTYIKISKNKKNIVQSNNKVNMDSEEFEKYFDVYSENNIVSMQLLTSDIMEILVDFYKKYKVKYEISIKNNMIYIRFFTGEMFEPKLFGKLMDKEGLIIYYCLLKFIIEVASKVNKTIEEIEV